jgi:hypothetical protein
MMYSLYYQAHVREKDCWFLVATLRSFEHLAFDRTFDTATSTFEFFVPIDNEAYFLQVMDYFVSHHIVTNLIRLPNRLINSGQQI